MKKKGEKVSSPRRHKDTKKNTKKRRRGEEKRWGDGVVG